MACALANRTHSYARELVYGFPISAPMLVLHADGFSAGAHKSFEGDSTYLIAACGMTSFAVCESVRSPDAKGFAAALMRILLWFSICHTLVIDKASAFFGIFRDVTLLLHLNCHVISSENHDAMLVERVNRFLNKGLRVMTNERNSVRIAAEAILLLIYAWNSAPIPGTDLPRSVVVTGRVFQFPIDFSASKHLELTSSPESVQSYARDQATLLSASRDIARILLEEHRSAYRERVNATRPDPRVFHPDDIVFAKRSTRSDARRGKVAKLMNAFTGPWRIVKKLDGASYEIEHCHTQRREKKHASMLSPYPLELIPFEPVDGPDNRFGQLFRHIGKSPYIDAGIKGFEPAQPFKLPANLASASPVEDFHWPSLAELNDELNPFPWLPGEEASIHASYDHPDNLAAGPAMYTGPPPDAPRSVPSTVPDITSLASSIIASQDRLFFVAPKQSASYREWRVGRVALKDSMALHPACLQNGKFLLDFYVRHDSDTRYNHLNQRYWLQYHTRGDILAPCDKSHTHLIRPSDTSEATAARKNLVPFRQWVNLTHKDTYIHGPFEFAAINGRIRPVTVSLETIGKSSLRLVPYTITSLPTWTSPLIPPSTLLLIVHSYNLLPPCCRLPVNKCTYNISLVSHP